jgi:hypothetical protein
MTGYSQRGRIVAAVGASLALLAGVLITLFAGAAPAGAGSAGIPTYTVVVTKTGSGAGTITSQPAGIVCGEICEGQFPPDTDVTLTATSSTGSRHKGWDGTVKGSTKRIVVTPPSDGLPVTVEATFDKAMRPVARLVGEPNLRRLSMRLGCGEPVSCELKVTARVRILTRTGYSAYQALASERSASTGDSGALWLNDLPLGPAGRRIDAKLRKNPLLKAELRVAFEDYETGLRMAINEKGICYCRPKGGAK